MSLRVPNHPPVISLRHEFQQLLSFVLGWRKVNWELHVGWRLRLACMWLCVMYSSSLFLHMQMAFASPRSHYRMNVSNAIVTHNRHKPHKTHNNYLAIFLSHSNLPYTHVGAAVPRPNLMRPLSINDMHATIINLLSINDIHATIVNLPDAQKQISGG